MSLQDSSPHRIDSGQKLPRFPPRTGRRNAAFLLTLCGLWLALDGRVWAQEPRDRPEQEVSEFSDFDELELDDLLDQRVSIAVGRVQALEDAPSVVTVITAREIREIGARSLEELLELVPGFEVLTDRQGFDRIAARGIVTTGSSENLLFLFNGWKVADGMLGFNKRIPVDDIERIEIIRGPGSALFGTGAFVGAINVVTKAEFRGLRVAAGGGSFETQEYNVLAGHSIGELEVSGFAQYTRTDGPRLQVLRDSQSYIDDVLGPILGIAPSSRAPGRTNEDYRSGDVNFQVSYKDLTLDGRFKDESSGSFFGANERLGPEDRIENRSLFLGVGFRHSFGERLGILARFSRNDSAFDRSLEIFPPGTVLPGGAFNRPDRGLIALEDGLFMDFDLKLDGILGDLSFDLDVSNTNQLTVGVGYERSVIDDVGTLANFDIEAAAPRPALEPARPFLPPGLSRSVFSVFLQDTWDPSPSVGLTAGVRFDRFSDFGSSVNPRAGFVWRTSPDLNVKLLYGRAFRSPYFNEQQVNILVITGTPDLDPSTVQTAEVAVDYRVHRNVGLRANYFAMFVRDLIVGEGATFVNREGIDSDGIEIEARAAFGEDLTGFMNYTYVHAIDLQTDARVPEIPSHMMNLGFTAKLQGVVDLSLSPTLVIRSSRPRIEEDVRGSLPGYALLNFTARVDFPKGLGLSAVLNNAFDKRYFDPAPFNQFFPEDYPRPGRSFFLMASYEF